MRPIVGGFSMRASPRTFRRKKTNDGSRLDYEKLAVVLGRKWGYITPEYLYHEMDLADVKDCAPFLGKDEWAYCWVGGKQDYSELHKLGVVSLKKG